MSGTPPAGDQATVTITVAVAPDEAFLLFTRDINLWWWLVNFAPDERTEVEVLFSPSASGTRVTVIHRGWSALRRDHPARHGLIGAEFIRMIGLWWGEQLKALIAHAGPADIRG
ncbi:MAG: hypothetical protein ABI790_11600 [Betaproteobacteria bacterium]